MENGRLAMALTIPGSIEIRAVGTLSDGELLERFVGERDRMALEVLVARHGPMVWGVCLRVLRDHHDAEDAFQATFHVLARRAAAVAPREMVGHWLHGVAYQTARKARAMRGKRRGREVTVANLPEPRVVRVNSSTVSPLDLAADLDRELNRLPAKYRGPLVLCELEGLTHREAADQLGWPVGTVAGRLSRGRALLARRLTGNSSAPTQPLPALLLAHAGAGEPLADALVAATSRAIGLDPAEQAVVTGLISDRVAELTERMMNSMIFANWKLLTGATLPLILAGLGAGLVAQQGGKPRPAPAQVTQPTGSRPAPPAAIQDPQLTTKAPGDPVKVDEALAKAVDGRIVRTLLVVKDCSVISYLPNWDHGNVDNLMLGNSGGRSLVAWLKIPAAEATDPNRRFLLALYSRKTIASPNAGLILAFEINDDWAERTSWKALPDYATEPAASFPFQPGEGWKTFDLTRLVRNRLKNGEDGRGIMLRFLNDDRRDSNWSGYEMVSREGEGEWQARRPALLIVEPLSK